MNGGMKGKEGGKKGGEGGRKRRGGGKEGGEGKAPARDHGVIETLAREARRQMVFTVEEEIEGPNTRGHQPEIFVSIQQEQG
jgi:hypothetical protein